MGEICQQLSLGVILEKKQGCYKRCWGHSDCKILLLQEGNGLSHMDDNENVLCAGTKSCNALLNGFIYEVSTMSCWQRRDEWKMLQEKGGTEETK